MEAVRKLSGTQLSQATVLGPCNLLQRAKTCWLVGEPPRAGSPWGTSNQRPTLEEQQLESKAWAHHALAHPSLMSARFMAPRIINRRLQSCLAPC